MNCLRTKSYSHLLLQHYRIILNLDRNVTQDRHYFVCLLVHVRGKRLPGPVFLKTMAQCPPAIQTGESSTPSSDSDYRLHQASSAWLPDNRHHLFVHKIWHRRFHNSICYQFSSAAVGNSWDFFPPYGSYTFLISFCYCYLAQKSL